MLDPQQSVETIPALYIHYEQIPHVHACKTRSPTVDMRVLGCLRLPHILLGRGRTILSVPSTEFSWSLSGLCIVCVHVCVCVDRCGSLDILKKTSKVLCDKIIN